MCAGAILNARIARVVYGAPDLKAGSCGTVCNLFAMPYQHRPALVGGVMEQACTAVLKDFFARLRQRKEKRLDWRQNLILDE